MRRIIATIIILSAAVFISEGLRAQKCESGNCMKGKGVMVWPDARYDGQWKNGTMEGSGTMLWKDGKRYTGGWKAGVFSGKGKLIWESGDMYEGTFANGKMEGQGTMKWKSGDRFDGQWKNNTMNGTGTMRYANGMTVKGSWKDGQPVSESKESKAGKEDDAMAGSWQLFCKSVPRTDDVFDIPATKYEFTAGGTGTFAKTNTDGTTTGAIRWALKKGILTITEYREDNSVFGGPYEYTYNAKKKWYARTPEPWGPEQKKMVVCVIKKAGSK